MTRRSLELVWVKSGITYVTHDYYPITFFSSAYRIWYAWFVRCNRFWNRPGGNLTPCQFVDRIVSKLDCFYSLCYIIRSRFLSFPLLSLSLTLPSPLATSVGHMFFTEL